jgi:hypothetical protein
MLFINTLIPHVIICLSFFISFLVSSFLPNQCMSVHNNDKNISNFAFFPKICVEFWGTLGSGPLVVCLSNQKREMIRPLYFTFCSNFTLT